MDKTIGPGNLVLKIFRNVGDFPLYIKKDGVQFSKVQIFKTLGFATLCTFFFCYFLFVEFSERGKLLTFLELLEVLGLVPIDFAIGAMMSNITAASAWMNHYLLFKKKEKIETFLLNISMFITNNFKRTFGSVRNSVICYGLLFLSFLGNLVGWTIIYAGNKSSGIQTLSVESFVVYAILGNFCINFQTTIPVTFGTELLFNIMIQRMAKQLDDWSELFDSDRFRSFRSKPSGCLDARNTLSDPTHKLSSHLESGLKLCKMVQEFNTEFKSILAINFVFNYIAGSCGLYIASSLVIFRKSNAMIVFSLSFLVFSLVHFSRVVDLCRSGQTLVDSMRKSLNKMTDYLLTCDESRHLISRAEPHEKYLLEQKVGHLRRSLENRYPLSPFSAFTISYQGLFTASGVGITYIIVLLQFKISFV